MALISHKGLKCTYFTLNDIIKIIAIIST
jgi:hypothetical protein